MSSSVTKKVDRRTAESLRDHLTDSGFETAKTPPYAVYQVRGPGAVVTYYESGKLVLQGKAAAELAATYLDVAIVTDADGKARVAPAAPAPEDRVTEGVIGVDESGKGDYFGPLVVAAMHVEPEEVPILTELGIRDSKTVSDQAARRVARTLLDAYPDRIEVISIGPPRYCELRESMGSNLNRLLSWGHAKVIQTLAERHGAKKAVSDRFGDPRRIVRQLERNGVVLDLDSRPRAESHPAVAAASVLARARFLAELERLSDLAGVRLPKGAGAGVEDAARRLFQSGGLEALRPYAKLHFKTTQKIQG